MHRASCPAREAPGQDTPQSVPLSPEAWSALTRTRRDIVIDGWLRDASITDLRPLGLDGRIVTAVFVRANGMFDQRSWFVSSSDAPAC